MSCLDGPRLRKGEVAYRMDMSKGLDHALADVIARAAANDLRPGDIVGEGKGVERIVPRRRRRRTR